jgi:hypothetical protein
LNARLLARRIIAELRITTERHEVIVDRLEYELIEAEARGRRIAKHSMKRRPRKAPHASC